MPDPEKHQRVPKKSSIYMIDPNLETGLRMEGVLLNPILSKASYSSSQEVSRHVANHA